MKRMHHCSCWLLAMVLACVAPWVHATSASFEQRLLEADRVRSSDPERFTALLAELDEATAQAEPGQLQRLQYLRAYQSVVYLNQPQQGITQAKELFRQSSGVELRFRAGLLLVNSYALSRKFSDGLRVLNQVLPMRNSIEDLELRHDGINVAGVFYNQLGQYKLGLQYAGEVLAGDASPRARCVAGISRVEAHYRLGMLPDDDAQIHRDIELCLASGERMAANFIRVFLARKWADRGETDQAIDLLEEHLPEVNEIGYHRLIADVHALLAELKLAKGKLESAGLHAEVAVSQAEQIANSLSLVAAYDVLYKIAELRGDPVAALALYRKYAEADKAHLADVKARELAYEIVRHETLQKNQQIALLNQQNQVLQLQQNLDRQAARNTRLLIALLVVLMATIVYWAYRTKRRHVTLRRLAETDALTGICNRQHFTRLAEQTLAQCAKDGEPAALVMFDLDHFKTINDSYGHVTGDWVLQRVAETCKGFCRRIDHLGRLGGEEFAILLHGCDLDAATRLAEDCRTRIARIETGDSGHAFTVTASFGVTATSVSGYALMPLLSHSDLALYRAKREGRNRVRSYAPELPAQSPLQVVSTIDGKPIHEKRGPLGIVGS